MSHFRKREHAAFKNTPSVRAMLGALECVCIAAVVVCAFTLSYWTDGTYNLAELARGFEQSSVFLDDVEIAIRDKIRCLQNEEIFETGGEEDLTRQIDIRQYASGVDDAANRNENTTYLLSDLINFYPKTGELQDLLEELSVSTDPADATVDHLVSRASGLETVLPLSGNRLADTAKLSSSPYTKLVEYYTDLCSASRDLWTRYQDYSREKGRASGQSSAYAPSNIRYFVENTSTKQYYTNMDARNCSQAKSMIAGSDDLTFLFEGVRTMSIMVAASEHCLNQEVTNRFIDTAFLGSNERIVIAIVDGYPAGDQIRQDLGSYEKREPLAIGSLVTGIAMGGLLAALFVLSICLTGREEDGTLSLPGVYDELPTEIAAGISVAIELMVYYFFSAAGESFGMLPWRNALTVLFAVSEYMVFLLTVLSIARRRKHRTLWTNSVLYTVIQVSTRVIGTRVSTRKLLIVYGGFIVANFVLPKYFESTGGTVVIVMDLALLLYLMREQVGKMSVREGLREISKGRLDYRIDESGLAGDSLEMARAVNDMADGLQKAVDSMVRGERLKAELITNVSHDLKTPLTSIINYVDILKHCDIQDPKALEYIAILDRKSQRLKALISDLIDVSRISSGNVALDMQLLDFHQMVLMAEGEFEDRFEDRDLHCSLSLPQGKITIRADGQQLYRVLSNLFSNVAKYAMPGTEVRICLAREDGNAVCTIENESRSELSKSGEELEERFVRGDLSRSSNEEGSGLGLSIAKNLTELMGGTFSVVTAGHTFTAKTSFPAAEGGAAAQS